MIRAIFNFLLGIRKVFQSLFSKAFEKFRDPTTGKISGISTKNLRTLGLAAFMVFFLGILMFQIFGGKSQIPGGLDEFRKEMTPKLGVGESEQNFTSPFGDDPLTALNNMGKTGDPLADIRNSGDDANADGKNPVTGEKKDPSVSDCLDLVDKMKAGTVLTGADKENAQICIEKNIANLSPEEIAAMKMLMRDDLTQAERDAIRKQLAGDLDPDSLEGKIAKALLAAARANDEKALQDARNALAALEAKNGELAEALLKKATDEPTSDRENALIKAFLDRLGSQSTTVVGEGGDKEASAKQLAADIASREAAMRALADQLAKAQADAAKSGEKIAKGLTLSPAEQEAIRKLTELQRQQAELAKLQDARRQALAKLMRGLQQTLAQVTVTMQQTYPSGISVEMADLVDCNKVKPLPFKRVVKPGTGNKGGVKGGPGSKEVWLSGDGEPLTPDKVRLVQLYRKKKAEEGKTRAGITNPLGGGPLGDRLGEKVDLAQVFGEEGGATNIDITALTIFADKSLKSFNLTPDMKIAAYLDSEILISDKGGSQSVRVRIIEDVHNPETGEIVIPKGGIAIAQTNGFDADTGIMDLNFDKVTIGAGKVVSVKLQIGSGDGTMGLKGQVRDTTGKFLLGTFITSFTAGALNWFSQSIIQDYITQTDAGNALLGASMQGGSDVMQRVADLYAGKLQNAAKIFYVPKHVPVVLFPQ